MNSFAWWPTLIVLAVATFTDLRQRRIPNWLVPSCWPGSQSPLGCMAGMGPAKVSPAWDLAS